MNAPEGRFGSRLGPEAMSARCPVCPKADTTGRIYEYTPELDAARRSRALSRTATTARPARRRHCCGWRRCRDRRPPASSVWPRQVTCLGPRASVSLRNRWARRAVHSGSWLSGAARRCVGPPPGVVLYKNRPSNSEARPSRSGNTTESVMPRSANSLIMHRREARSTTYPRSIDLGTNVLSPLLLFPCIVKHDLWLRSREWTYVGWMATGSRTPGTSFSQAPRRFSKAGLTLRGRALDQMRRPTRFGSQFGSGSCQTRGNSRTAEG